MPYAFSYDVFDRKSDDEDGYGSNRTNDVDVIVIAETSDQAEAKVKTLVPRTNIKLQKVVELSENLRPALCSAY